MVVVDVAIRAHDARTAGDARARRSSPAGIADTVAEADVTHPVD